MWIERDISKILSTFQGSYLKVLMGPRQCGKSSLINHILPKSCTEVTFDDLQMRQLANADPALFLDNIQTPALLDEVQYAPELFPELKKKIDQKKQQALKAKTETIVETLYWLTGSNQILLDRNIKETLTGRATYYSLHTLTVHEILRAFPKKTLAEILFIGGWPELYTNAQLSPMRYLNDYITTYLEKEIVMNTGIEKLKAFGTVLSLLAGRTAQFLNYSNIANDSGVKSVTINEWVSHLEHNHIVYLLPATHHNLIKRLTKMPKIYFLDTGLAVRLQGWLEITPLLMSPQSGALFETLVLAEIVKFCMNFDKQWRLSVWHTKEGEEIDFVIETPRGKVYALDAKLAIQGIQPQTLPSQFKKAFPETKEIIIVSIGGDRKRLNATSQQVPIAHLTEWLLEIES